MDKSNTITLYHGSIYDFDKIDITHGKPYKDFGRGFYTSRVEQHASSLAVRNKEIEYERNALRGKKADNKAWLYVYELDLIAVKELKTKEFTAPDREWMKFVVLNRISRTTQHDYDIVIGATANDNTRASIQVVLSAAGGNILTDKALDALIALVEPENLPSQVYFGTQRAADFLKLKSRRIIR